MTEIHLDSNEGEGLKRRMKQIMLIGLMMSAFLTASAGADTVILKNGDQLSGKDCSVSGEKVTLQTDYAKKVELDLAAVEKITYQEPVRLIYLDGSEEEVRELIIAELDFTRIDAVNPPRLPVWSLDLNAGYSLNSGNSNTQDVNLQVTVVRLIKESYRLTGHGEYFWGTAEDKDTGKDDTVTDRGLASLQADLFLIKNGYLYGRSEISYDKMKDLNRRLDNGLGLGYQVYQTDDAFIDLEAGSSYIDSKYDDGTGDHGIYLRLAENGELKINNRLVFYESVEYKPKVDNYNDYLLNAEAGIRVSLTAGLYFKVSVIDWYDNTPAAGKKRNDVSVISSLGLAL